jgi:SAM-dependent methyltransferase
MSSLTNRSIDPIEKSVLEITPCPICKSSDMSVLHTFEPFKVVSCRSCGLIYLNPRMKESAMMKVYQENEYFSDSGDSGYQYVNYASQEESMRMTFRRFLNELKKNGIASGRLLELGCGYGYFLDEAKHFFSFLAGTELSQEAGESARKISGADVYIGDVSSLPNELCGFDLIVSINVIEHIYSPAEFILSLKKRLKEGGRIIIATPDIGSIWYKIMQRRWSSFKIPEHVVYYSKNTLTSLLLRTGFHNIMGIPFHHAFPFGLITSKLGIHLHGPICRKPVWLPWTMTAISAQAT